MESLDELCASVKEPEEIDHTSKCHLLHDEQLPVTNDDWVYILGHDRLKKRVGHLSFCS